jgi:hypothetical protein
VPWGIPFKICSQGSEIPNIFQTGSEQLRKKRKIFKNLSRTISATGEQKPVS